MDAGGGLAQGGDALFLALDVGEELGLAGLLLLDDGGGGLGEEGLVAELGLDGGEELAELRELLLGLGALAMVLRRKMSK